MTEQADRNYARAHYLLRSNFKALTLNFAVGSLTLRVQLNCEQGFQLIIFTMAAL